MPKLVGDRTRRQIGSATVTDFHRPVSPYPERSARYNSVRLLTRGAVERLRGGNGIRVESIRSTRLRNQETYRIDSLSVIYEAGGTRRQALLWGRIYENLPAADDDVNAASRPGSPRKLLSYSPQALAAIEVDLGEPFLPPIH